MSDKDCRIIYEIFFAAFYLQKTLKSKAVVKMHLWREQCSQRLSVFAKNGSLWVWIAMANLLYKVVNETSKLSCLFESNSILVYQLYEFVGDTTHNLSELSLDYDYDYFHPYSKNDRGRFGGGLFKVTVWKRNSLDRSLDFYIIGLV